MSRKPSETAEVSPYYQMFQRRAQGEYSEDAAPLFEAGSSNEKGITRIKVEQIEPKALAGFRGSVDWRFTEEQLLIEYGPGVYRLTAYQGSKAIDVATVTIQGDRDEWDLVRRSFMVGGSSPQNQQNREVLTMMREMMESQKEQQERTSQLMIEMQQKQSQAQLQVATDMASLHRTQAQSDLARLELQLKAERERYRLEMERINAQHEQQMEREAARRRDELRAERERLADERAREREFNMMMMKVSDGQQEKTVSTLAAMKDLFSDPDKGNGDLIQMLIGAAPELLKQLGPGDQQQIMAAMQAANQQAAAAQQEAARAQQAQQEAVKVVKAAESAQIEAQQAKAQAQQALKQQLRNPPPKTAPKPTKTDES